MATATAHFDLTKAGSNENYNVGLVNSNLDKIDQQMYLNQTSAAKVMVGATASTDGESGRVPAPTPSDSEKYLKGDGTWDTPSGGGGGSSTLSGLTDVDLSSPTNGQILKYNSTTQKWENADEGGSSQRTYLGQLIPRVSASDSKITASTSNSSYSAWGAFNGTSPSNLSSPDANSCWLPEVNLTDQWIKYHFDAPRYFTKIEIVCFSNYSSDWVGDIKVEGSTDGSTWTNILASGTTYELTAELQTSTTVEINLDDTDLWEYIRVTFVDEMSVAYQPSCFIDEIYVYGGEEISGGGGNSWTDLTAVLEAGETSLTIIDSHITINGTYDFYTSKYGLNPLSVVIDDPFETRLLQPLVTQESELIVTATASTNWSGFEPWKAFADSAVNSGWIASGGSGGYWLQAEFPYEVNISSIDFKSLDSNRSYAISRVSYSNDGNTFTDATLTSSTMQNNIGHADVSMSETAKYIRLCFDYSLGTQTYPMVSQLELYGYIDSSSAGSMTLTFKEQTENINVKVRVS